MMIVHAEVPVVCLKQLFFKFRKDVVREESLPAIVAILVQHPVLHPHEALVRDVHHARQGSHVNALPPDSSQVFQQLPLALSQDKSFHGTKIMPMKMAVVGRIFGLCD